MVRHCSKRVVITCFCSLLAVLGATQTENPNSKSTPKTPVPAAEKGEGMILIPGGTFIMGQEMKEEEGDNPAHEVTVSPFHLDVTEVTNAQYHAFCQDTGHRLPEFWEKPGFRSGPDYPHHPVFGVSWFDATAYAEWCGKRLPTEAEWEFAAQGGKKGLKYPNSNEIDPSMGNYWISRLDGPVPVGSYPANGFGLYDMMGNVVEWVADRYAPTYEKPWPRVDPRGPDKGKFRVIRGGGWHSGPGCSSLHFRNALPMGWVDIAVGFRCAKDVDTKEKTAATNH